LLKNWLEAEGYAVNYTKRRTSKLVAKAIADAQAKKTLTPVTYSLIHVADFADTLENEIIPALKAGVIVTADRYIFTSFARDTVRGNDTAWVERLHSFALAPDGLFYLDVPIEVSMSRTPISRVQEFYRAGMDIGLADEPEECFRLFHTKIMEQFKNRLLKEHPFDVLDGTRPIHVIQRELREKVRRLL